MYQPLGIDESRYKRAYTLYEACVIIKLKEPKIYDNDWYKRIKYYRDNWRIDLFVYHLVIREVEGKCFELIDGAHRTFARLLQSEDDFDADVLLLSNKSYSENFE